MRTLFVLPIICFVIISCAGGDVTQMSNVEVIEWNDFQHIDLTDGRLIKLDPLMQLNDVDAYDSLLILNGRSVANNGLLHLYDPGSGQLVVSFANSGRGPGEILAVGEIQVNKENASLYFFDGSQRRTRVYSLDSILAGKSDVISTRGFNLGYRALKMLDSETYLIFPFTPPAEGSLTMLMMYSADKGLFENAVSYPPVIELDSVINRWHYGSVFPVTAGNVTFNRESERIVLAHMNSDLIELFDLKLRLVMRIHGPDQFVPVFRFAPPGTLVRDISDIASAGYEKARDPFDVIFFPNGTARRGYYRIYGVDEGFFVSYNGGFRGEPWACSNLLFFTYDGKPLIRYTFDRGFSGRFAVDMERSVLYIIGTDMELYAYSLPAIK